MQMFMYGMGITKNFDKNLKKYFASSFRFSNHDIIKLFLLLV